jgi:lysophospholipase L1-like esterase
MTKPLLLILGCGAAKRDVACQAGEMYLGSMWQTLRHHAPKGRPMRVLVMSAAHGLIDAATVIEPYDAVLDATQAARLAADPAIKANVAALWDDIFGAAGGPVNDVEGYTVAGEAYVAALEQLLPEDASLEILSTGGLLAKRRALREWLDRKAA